MEDLEKELKDSKIVIKPSKMIISKCCEHLHLAAQVTPDIRNSFSTLMSQLSWAKDRDRARKVAATCP